jgi:hypothetical protein
MGEVFERASADVLTGLWFDITTATLTALYQSSEMTKINSHLSGTKTRYDCAYNTRLYEVVSLETCTAH